MKVSASTIAPSIRSGISPAVNRRSGRNSQTACTTPPAARAVCAGVKERAAQAVKARVSGDQQAARDVSRSIFFSIEITTFLYGLVSLAVVVLATSHHESLPPLHAPVSRQTSIPAVGPHNLPPAGPAPAPPRIVLARSGVSTRRSMQL